ncbi:hypothetical protein SKAU_G00043830 [Synaphobranchus kaupii]|uniref:Uncharacterized protein n=1 Tax=Synaphobranchus kaupii TaxID=118154 RepID=A0A9Q1J8R8_SYNKA|nr:hypothetical protein SKAU_G00043830 [Synaphobranchus kaupii]
MAALEGEVCPLPGLIYKLEKASCKWGVSAVLSEAKLESAEEVMRPVDEREDYWQEVTPPHSTRAQVTDALPQWWTPLWGRSLAC